MKQIEYVQEGAVQLREGSADQAQRERDAVLALSERTRRNEGNSRASRAGKERKG